MRSTLLATRPQVKDVDWFIDQLLNISPNNLRLLWIPYPSDTTTTRQKNDGRIFTATDAYTKTLQGNGILVTFNGTSQQLSTPDTANLSFISAAFSIVTLVNVTDTIADRMILTKYNDTGLAREWFWRVGNLDTFQVQLEDESAGVTALRSSDAVITQGLLKLFSMVYTALSAGASAANDITLYDNISIIASNATNNVNYVAMEDLSAVVRIGAYSNGATPSQFMSGSMGFVALFSIALTLTQIIAIRNLCREYYGLTLN